MIIGAKNDTKGRKKCSCFDRRGRRKCSTGTDLFAVGNAASQLQLMKRTERERGRYKLRHSGVLRLKDLLDSESMGRVGYM